MAIIIEDIAKTAVLGKVFLIISMTATPFFDKTLLNKEF